MKQNHGSIILRLSYALLLVMALAAGIITLRYEMRFALVPAATVFGWTQIGGL